MEDGGHDRGGVAAVGEAVVGSCFGACAIVAVAGVYDSFFGADEEECWVGLGECHGCGCEVFGFGRGWGGEFEIFLGLGEHVDCPAADDAVG